MSNRTHVIKRTNGRDNKEDIIMNTDYSQFYRGTTDIKTYGNGTYKKDKIAKYEFNTTDEKGNKVMDQMSKEETLQAINNISNQYGENVIVEFSGDGLAALVESKKGQLEQPLTEEQQVEREKKQAAFESEIIHLENVAMNLPEYSGIYEVDKAIATAIENSSKEEQAFVYDIIRQNFLVSDSSSMTEEERQANISLGMKKAEYAAKNFMSKEQKESFMDAMEAIAKLATAGKKKEDGSMNYGISKANYLGHGSNLVYTTDSLGMMKQMDSKAYEEYQKVSNEGSNEDRAMKALKYLTNWYVNAVSKDKTLVERYENSSKEYVLEIVCKQIIDDTFKDAKTDSKQSFIESLKIFKANNPNFLTMILSKELSYYADSNQYQ